MDSLSAEQISTLIGTVGFPSLIAIILLRSVLGNFNQRLDDLDKRLLQLNKSIMLVDKTLHQLSSQATKDFKDSHLSNTESNHPRMVSKKHL
ncbi:hypothetical protein [Paenibacillus massiliensis]|uniref:hypothetical protein n=1 Tax=Paenibacillus massiliensis TaxID=225917 RepID=UPI00046F5DF0|nr:hypothetical protein [Paenibacillus massiliensis]